MATLLESTEARLKDLGQSFTQSALPHIEHFARESGQVVAPLRQRLTRLDRKSTIIATLLTVGSIMLASGTVTLAIMMRMRRNRRHM